MKVSIITVVYNGEKTIEESMKSVISQTYSNIEYILIDGGSTDGTVGIIKKYKDRISYWISESDNGIYDAINKGLKIASGEIIGLLNSDDLYTSENVIQKIVDAFEKNKVQGVYGDLLYVYQNDLNKIIRYWKAGDYKQGMLKKGWMPPHPTFFVKKEVYEKFGYFNSGFKISADYDIILRFIGKYKISVYYIQEVLVKMRIGGDSNKNIKNILKKSFEDYKAIRENNIGWGALILFFKNVSKIPQFFLRSNK